MADGYYKTNHYQPHNWRGIIGDWYVGIDSASRKGTVTLDDSGRPKVEGWGDVTSVVVLPVDADGKIVPPRIKPIRVTRKD